MTPKPTKSWGSGGGVTATSWFVQRPSELDLKLAELKFSSNSTTETYDVTDAEAAKRLAEWVVQPIIGGTGGTMSYSRSRSPIGQLTVVSFTLVDVHNGVEPLDEVDVGSDGEGGADYEVWSTAKNKKQVKDEYRIEWDDVTHWPPFMDHGKQLMDPEQVTAYKLLIGGKKPGDVVSMGGVVKALKDTGAGYDDNYFKLLKGKILIWKHITEESWVISNKAHASKYDPGDKAEEEELPDGTFISTICRENNGNKDRSREKKTWTVTRTTTRTELFAGQEVPKGATLWDVRKESSEEEQPTE